MRRQFHWDKKYLYWGITAFLVLAAEILFYMALSYLPALGKGLSALMRILSPFVWGLVITYLLHPLMKALERSAFTPLSRRLYKGKRAFSARRFARGLSVLVSEIVLIALIVALFYLILPQLYSSIVMIVDNSPTYIANLTAWVEKTLNGFPELEAYTTEALTNVNTNVFDWVRSTLLPGLGSVVSNVTTGVAYAVKAVYNLIIGIIVSVYILGNIEGSSAGARRFGYSLFGIESAEKLRDLLAFTDKTFMGFINGKLLDSAIIGLICYIVCAILSMPYALLVSVMIGVTNIIPFFGPLIGAVPSAIIILQQIDGNFIGPKILGNSIGISGFWVMFAIILGAGLFSFWGMLLGVPVFVLIYTAFDKLIVRRLKRNDLPWEIADYENLESIDPVTRTVVKKPETEE